MPKQSENMAIPPKVDIRESVYTALSGAKFPVQFLMFQDTLIGNAANLSVSQGWEITMGTLVPGQPPQSEAHASSLTATQASLVQAGYGMVVELTM